MRPDYLIRRQGTISVFYDHPASTPMDTKYERVAEVARVMSEGEAVVLIVLNGKEGSGYAVHADSGLNELLPSILRRVAKMIGPED
jgi:hypothetical protein